MERLSRHTGLCAVVTLCSWGQREDEIEAAAPPPPARAAPQGRAASPLKDVAANTALLAATSCLPASSCTGCWLLASREGVAWKSTLQQQSARGGA
jgi:hypothetical protein